MGDKEESKNRRSGKDRRDWNEFVVHERRGEKGRRTKKDRRTNQEFFKGSDRRKSSMHKEEPSSRSFVRSSKKPDKKKPAGKEFYTTSEAAELTGVSQVTLTLWIRNNVIDDAQIKRDQSGRRMWSEKNLKMIQEIKRSEGWN